MPKTEITLSNINIRESISILIGKLLFIDIIAAIFIIVLYVVLVTGGSLINFSYQNSYVFLSLFIIIGIGKILIDMYAILQWLNEYYEITPEYIVVKKGIFFRKEEKHRVDHIREVEFARNFFSEMFNAGSLIFYDQMLHKDLEMNYIHNPSRYLKILSTLNPEIEIKLEKVRKGFHEVEE